MSLEDYVSGNFNRSYWRASWCYGTPGIAKVLHEANRIVKSPLYKEIIESSISFVLEYPECWELTSPILCHGYCSLAIFFQSLMEEYQFEKLNKAHKHVVNQILKVCSSNFERGKNKMTQRHLSFLEGNLGVALVLINALTPKNRFWMNKLMMCRIEV